MKNIPKNNSLHLFIEDSVLNLLLKKHDQSVGQYSQECTFNSKWNISVHIKPPVDAPVKSYAAKSKT